MTAGPTPSSSEGKDAERAEYRRQGPHTSPYWDTYNPQESSYAGAEDRASAYGRYYPLERTGYDCGWEDGYSRSSLPGWRRALQDPSLAAIGLVVGAIATYVLFTAIPTAFRKKKRSNTGLDQVGDWLWLGLEEFEEKIDAIAEGEDDGETSWISKIYNQFSFFNDGDNSVEEADMEGLEPPLLDTTWGLGQRTKGISANATIEDAVELDQDANDNANRTKRAIKEEEEVREDDSEEKCRTEMWRCLSKVIEGGLHYMDQPQGILGLAKKTMFKIAFHGGFSNVWSGVMTIPEARQIKQCMTAHTSCVSYEILRREAQQTMDPTDPMVTMYNKEKMEEKEEKEDRQDNTKEKKRERLIINPEFVEGMDTGDGSLQYDEDYSHNQI